MRIDNKVVNVRSRRTENLPARRGRDMATLSSAAGARSVRSLAVSWPGRPVSFFSLPWQAMAWAAGGLLLLSALAATYATPAFAATRLGADVAEWVLSEGGRVTRDGLGRVSEIDLTSTWITDADLDQIGQLRHLTKLNLSHTWITDAGLERLKPLPNVRDLNLYYAEYVTDGGVAHLKGWEKIEHLNLRGTKVTSRVFEHLGELTTLRSLDIGFSRVTDDGFEHLANLEQLESLGFGGNKMSGVALPLLKLLPALRRLDVGGRQRTDSGLWGLALTDFNLESIEALTELEELILNDHKLSDLGMARLEVLTRLEAIDLSRTQVTSRGLASVAKLPRLKRLKLWQAEKVGAAAAQHLSAMKHLEVLDLAETSVSDDFLERFSAAAALKQLFLGGSNISAEAVETFRRKHPGMQVTWWEKQPKPAEDPKPKP